jgi:hypothetical protein
MQHHRSAPAPTSPKKYRASAKPVQSAAVDQPTNDRYHGKQIPQSKKLGILKSNVAMIMQLWSYPSGSG